MNFNYTYSRARGVVDNDSDQIMDPFNIHQMYGPASYDQPNVFTLDFVYALPKLNGAANPVAKQALNGWEVSGMIRSQSGMPVSVCSNGNLFGWNLGNTNLQNTTCNQFPNLTGDAYANTNKFQWLNPSAFTRPADGEFGNLGRNALRLPRVNNVDASLMKNFNFTERTKLTFRAEAFNLFNHPQVWGVNNTFQADNPGSAISATDKAFGQANSWRDARTLQLALRFSF
jgi:hypothetical protein